MARVIKVQSIGEHVVVTPGRFEVASNDGATFVFENSCGGSVEIMFLPSRLPLSAQDEPLPVGEFSHPVNHGESSTVYTVAADAPHGEYEYIVKYQVGDPTPEEVRLRLGSAEVGLAIGGSSPRIIVKDPPVRG